MKISRRTLIGGTAAFALAGSFYAGGAEAATKWNKDIGFLRGANAAIGGYDPVAYFTKKGPVKGNPKFKSRYDGGTFFFSSAKNKGIFDGNPAKYAPQFGGYCAYAVSKGYSAKIDPGAWTISGGKLYLNYSDQVRATWLGDIKGNISKGNRNWPSVKAGL